MTKETQTNFLAVAESIGVRLCRDAIWSGARCNWLGDSMEFTNHAWTVVHRSFGPELYNGTSGIALFLARLHQATGERLFRHTAEGALAQAISRRTEVAPVARIGFYSGLTGIAYALVSAGELFGDEQMIEQAFEILSDLERDNPQAQGLDVISGSAGAIPVLLSIQRRHLRPGGEALLALAQRHGEHLLQEARKSERGWSWDTLKMPGQRDLTGFSHGAAGIAWALLELAQATGEKKYRVAAEHGFQYERSWFNAEQQNWPDFRNQDNAAESGSNTLGYTLAWCHGAPGIGLSRLRAFALLGDAVYQQEAEAALRATTAMLTNSVAVGQSNYSLCHGLCGNAELLLYASQVLPRPEDLTLAREIGAQGYGQFHQPRLPWPCGVPGGGETPNLMLGLAGIGYFYLRLHDPQQYPPLVIVLP